jgi:hypothetical protein
MTRSLPVLAFASLLLVACSTSKPVAEAPPVDPANEPTIVGAIDEAALQGTDEGEAAARTGRRIGRIAGVIAAVAGGPSIESAEDVVDRYRRTRDAIETTAAVIGTTTGVVSGAKRGFELDLQFAELLKIEGVQATRPFPDEIIATFDAAASPELLEKVATVFRDRESRAIDIDAAGDEATRVRDSLTALGAPAAGIEAHRNDDLDLVVLRIRYRI